MRQLILAFSLTPLFFWQNLWGQDFLSKADYKTIYVGQFCCQGKLENWAARDNLYLKRGNKNSDTVEFMVYFNTFFQTNSLSGHNDKITLQNKILVNEDFFFRLKLIDDKVFLFRPKKSEDEWAYKDDFPIDHVEIINLKDSIGVVRDGSYFFERSEYFSITLKSKTYNNVLADTLYHYVIKGGSFPSHGGITNGFLFSKLFGFLRWDYIGGPPSCQGFLLNKKWKKALLKEIRCDKF